MRSHQDRNGLRGREKKEKEGRRRKKDNSNKEERKEKNKGRFLSSMRATIPYAFLCNVERIREGKKRERKRKKPFLEKEGRGKGMQKLGHTFLGKKGAAEGNFFSSLLRTWDQEKRRGEKISEGEGKGEKGSHCTDLPFFLFPYRSADITGGERKKKKRESIAEKGRRKGRTGHVYRFIHKLLCDSQPGGRGARERKGYLEC